MYTLLAVWVFLKTITPPRRAWCSTRSATAELVAGADSPVKDGSGGVFLGHGLQAQVPDARNFCRMHRFPYSSHDIGHQMSVNVHAATLLVLILTAEP